MRSTESQQPNERVPSPAKRRHRRWLLIAGAGAAAALAALILLSPPLLAGTVRRIIVHELGRRLKGEVGIGKVSVGLIRGVRVHDLVIRNAPDVGEGECLRAPRVHARVGLLPLLSKRLRARVTLIRPQINVVRAEDGRFNLDGLLAETPDEEPSGWQGSFDILLRGGSVHFDDRLARSTIDARNVDATVTGLAGGGERGAAPPARVSFAAKVGSAKAGSSVRGEGEVEASGATRFSLNLATLPLQPFRAYLPEQLSAAVSNGTVDGDTALAWEPGGNLKITGKLGIDGLRPPSPDAEALPTVAVQYALALDTGAGSATLDSATLRLPGTVVRASGSLSPKLKLTVITDSRLAKAAPLMAPGLKVAGHLTATSTVSSAEGGAVIAGSATVRGFTYSDPASDRTLSEPLVKLTHRVKLDTASGAADVQLVQLSTDWLDVKASGTVSLSPGAPNRAEIDITCRAKIGAAVAASRPWRAIPAAVDLGGRADSSIKLVIDARGVDCRGTAALSDFVANGLLPGNRRLSRDRIDVAFSAVTGTRSLAIRNLSIKDPAVSARLSGHVPLRRGAAGALLKGDFSASLDKVVALLGDMAPSALKTSGKATGSIEVRPTREATTLALSIDASEADIRYASEFVKKPKEACTVSLAATIGPDGLKVKPIEVALGPIRLAGEAALAKDGATLVASASGDEIDTDALGRFFPAVAAAKLAGLASVTAHFTADLRAEDLLKGLSGRFDVRAAEATLQGHQLTSLHVAGQLKEGRLKTDEAVVRAYGGNVTAQATVDLTSAEPTFRVTATGKDIAAGGSVPILKFPIPILGASRAQMDGVLSFDAAMEGGGLTADRLRKSLKGTGHLNSKGGVRVVNPWFYGPLARYADLTFDSIAGEFAIADGRIDNKELTLASEKLDVIVDGWTRFDGTMLYAMQLKDKGLFGRDLRKLVRQISPDGSITLQVGGTVTKPQPKILSTPLIRNLLEQFLEKWTKKNGEQPEDQDNRKDRFLQGLRRRD